MDVSVDNVDCVSTLTTLSNKSHDLYTLYLDDDRPYFVIILVSFFQASVGLLVVVGD